MRCAFCGVTFTGNPINQGGEVYCSIECADMAAELMGEEGGYYEEGALDYEPLEDE